MLGVILALGLGVTGCKDVTDLVSGGDVTYEAVQEGGSSSTTTSTSIKLSFNAAVSSLTAGEINVNNDGGAVTKGELTGDGAIWRLALASVTTQGNVKVSITKSGIERAVKTVAVYKASAADTTAPTLSGGSATNLTTTAGTTATLGFTSSEAGTYSYLVLTSSASAPDAAAVKAQGTAVAKGTAPAVSGANTINVTGLTASQTYTAYIVVSDAAGNDSTVLTIPGVNPVTGTDPRATLTAGEAVDALAADTTAQVTFTGATGVTGLSEADFTVTGGTFTSASVISNTATVVVGFAANLSTTAKTYTVSIASGSTKIKGSASVTITQAAAASDTRTTLTAGSPVNAAAADTSASVTFTGATSLSLGNTDFAADNGGTVTGVSVSADIATVTVSFEVNTFTEATKAYIVSIASSSTKIKGSTTVAITQAAASDTRVTLTAGEAVNAAAADTTANVTFTGATGVTGLTAADFTVDGGTFTSADVSGGTAIVAVGFAANAETTAKTITVAVKESSTKIKGDASVAITQAAADTRATLIAGGGVNAAAADTTANVTFTGATGVTGLTTADFTVTGGTFTSADVSGGTAIVVVGFAANAETTAKTITVAVKESSTKIKGGASVAITQAADTRKTLTPQEEVGVAATDTTANLTFVGATGVTGLTADDFTITGGTFISASVNFDIATVVVGFEANTTATAKAIMVNGNASSTKIKVSATGLILQFAADTRATLIAGGAVNAAAAATSASVTFTGATGVTGLTTADFTVTGGTFTSADVSGDIATVAVGFEVNTDETTAKTITVAVNASSTKITGGASVTITQARLPRSIKTTLGIDTTGIAGVTDTFNAVHTYLSGKTADQLASDGTIRLGDYIDLEAGIVVSNRNYYNTSLEGHGTLLRLIVVGINSFNASGSYTGNGTDAHLVFQFQNAAFINQMETTDTTANGYSGSKMKGYVASSIYQGLISAGVPDSVLWAPGRYVVNKGYNPTGAARIYDKVWLPTERELFGSRTYSSTTYETEANQARLEYYTSDALRIKYNESNIAEWYWLASPYSNRYADSLYHFCGASSLGLADYDLASTRSGVAPAFCVK
jgi:hypothetical protein